MKYILFALVLLTFASCSVKKGLTSNADRDTPATELSIKFLTALKDGNNTDRIKAELQAYKVEDLSKELDSDPKRFTFWVNIYNAYIQDILSNNPELYQDRGAFFREPRIELLGRTFAFGEIEHGILRRSQNEYGLGYIRKWFPPSWERKLRVKNRDYRLHFALNCGAKDCPAVAIYNASKINDQLAKGTSKYLLASSEYNESQNTVNVTSLFSWFRGDFGGKSGSRTILKEQKVIPTGAKPKLQFNDYDWTLYLDNFIDL